MIIKYGVWILHTYACMSFEYYDSTISGQGDDLVQSLRFLFLELRYGACVGVPMVVSLPPAQKTRLPRYGTPKIGYGLLACEYIY